MNVRGGNGYIEEWVNARLVRDCHLGSIWEGAENVVALDVARAATRQRAHDALFSDLEARLDAVTDPVARVEARLVREQLRRAASRFEALLAAPEEERDARMAAMCDRLAALVCSVLLLGEADGHALAGGGYRKVVANNIAGAGSTASTPRLSPAGVRWSTRSSTGGRPPWVSAPCRAREPCTISPTPGAFPNPRTPMFALVSPLPASPPPRLANPLGQRCSDPPGSKAGPTAA